MIVYHNYFKKTSKMRAKLFLFIFFLCTFGIVFGQVPSDTLKILSYNIRFGELASLEELANFIKAEDPDLVALQEVDFKTYRDRTPQQHGKDFVTELGFRTGMLSAYGKTINYANGYYGIGILSKYPMASVERVYLPFTENGKEQRAVLISKIELGNSKSIFFASTHLDYTNTNERQLQVRKLNEVLQEKTIPVILCGDFNARPEAIEIDSGMSKWIRLDDGAATVPAESPKYKIDYIFGYPKENIKPIKAYTPMVTLSDHLPLYSIVTLEWH